jgi:hypothetical protein
VSQALRYLAPNRVISRNKKTYDINKFSNSNEHRFSQDYLWLLVLIMPPIHSFFLDCDVYVFSFLCATSRLVFHLDKVVA